MLDVLNDVMRGAAGVMSVVLFFGGANAIRDQKSRGSAKLQLVVVCLLLFPLLFFAITGGTR